MRVAICVMTYRRPRWLTACLNSLAAQVLDRPVELTIVVVDNDRDAGSRDVVEGIRPQCPWPIVYEVEPEQGISFARNRAAAAALRLQADFIAFIDDDEEAEPGWLAELLRVQERFRADVVSGPVVPRYEEGVPDWAVRGRFFERPRHPTGASLDATRSGNCLFVTRLVANDPMPFDPKFALSGGSDTHFFRQVHREGASIVWADDAIVHERVPASRATAGWVLQRAYRGGACFAVSERLGQESSSWIPRRLLTGVGRGALGLLLVLPSVVLGKAGIMRALQMTFIGAGLISGIFGFLYREYSVVHGE